MGSAITKADRPEWGSHGVGQATAALFPNPTATFAEGGIDSPSLTKLTDPEDDVRTEMLRAGVLGMFGGLGYFWNKYLITTHVINGQLLTDAIYKRSRPEGQGLITVMNHTSEFDDPGSLTAASTYGLMFETRLVRWTIAARDQIFTNNFDYTFFNGLKCLPVTRGGGLFQDDLNLHVERLNDGDWINVFPEGRISMNDPNVPLLTFRPGVGRLICEADVTPMVIPVYNQGFNLTKPPDRAPKIGKHIEVHVVVGKQIFFDDLFEEYENRPKLDLYRAVARRCEYHVGLLRRQLRARTEHEHVWPPEVADTN